MEGGDCSLLHDPVLGQTDGNHRATWLCRSLLPNSAVWHAPPPTHNVTLMSVIMPRWTAPVSVRNAERPQCVCRATSICFINKDVAYLQQNLFVTDPIEPPFHTDFRWTEVFLAPIRSQKFTLQKQVYTATVQQFSSLSSFLFILTFFPLIRSSFTYSAHNLSSVCFYYFQGKLQEQNQTQLPSANLFFGISVSPLNNSGVLNVPAKSF
jgi:hypothetical protein